MTNKKPDTIAVQRHEVEGKSPSVMGVTLPYSLTRLASLTYPLGACHCECLWSHNGCIARRIVRCRSSRPHPHPFVSSWHLDYFNTPFDRSVARASVRLRLTPVAGSRHERG